MTDEPVKTRIQTSTHAYIPATLYKTLFRSAVNNAVNGDKESADWVYNELFTQLVQEKKHEFLLLKRSGVLDDFKGKPCVSCGVPSDTIDHIVAINNGGTNDLSNLQPMCRRCNQRKSDNE